MASKQVRQISVERQITLLDQRENFADSKKVAAEFGGRLPTKTEFIKALKDPKFYEEARGTWYWLSDDPGLKISGASKIDYEKGDIVSVSQKEYDALPREQRAWAYKGSGPLALGVDYYDYDVRLALGTDVSPEGAARVAVVKDAQAAPSVLKPQAGETLEITLRDGQKMQVDAKEVKVVKRQ